MDHTRRPADHEYERGAGRRSLDDRDGAQLRSRRDVLLRPTFRQRKSRRHAVEKRPDWLRCPHQLRLTVLPRSENVQRKPWRSGGVYHLGKYSDADLAATDAERQADALPQAS